MGIPASLGLSEGDVELQPLLGVLTGVYLRPPVKTADHTILGVRYQEMDANSVAGER